MAWGLLVFHVFLRQVFFREAAKTMCTCKNLNISSNVQCGISPWIDVSTPGNSQRGALAVRVVYKTTEVFCSLICATTHHCLKRLADWRGYIK